MAHKSETDYLLVSFLDVVEESAKVGRGPRRRRLRFRELPYVPQSMCGEANEKAEDTSVPHNIIREGFVKDSQDLVSGRLGTTAVGNSFSPSSCRVTI